MSDNNTRILLPAPIISELLSPVPPSEHTKILSLIDKRFQVAPFDNLAALKCAELMNKVLTDEEIKEYREQHSVPKNKIKFDCMIASIAITKKCFCIYSNDPDMKKFSCNQIKVFDMPEIKSQSNLFQ